MSDVIARATPPAPAAPRPSRLRPITDAAVAQTLATVHAEAPAQVKATLSTADGGTARISLETRWRQLEIAGYGGWKRRQGFEAGVEVVHRLTPR